MTDDTKTPAWNGIPDNPASSGWHWIGPRDYMWPCKWDSEMQAWGSPFIDVPLTQVAQFEYLGPCTPPVTRCADGSRRVAVSAEVRGNSDEVYIRMNDRSSYFMDGWYWHNGKPVIDIIGKTIPEIKAAQKVYRDPAPEGEVT